MIPHHNHPLMFIVFNGAKMGAVFVLMSSKQTKNESNPAPPFFFQPNQ